MKERLIGAAVLAALAIWLIPWLLDGPDEPTADSAAPLELPVPSGHIGELRTEVIDLSPRGESDRSAPASSRSGAAVSPAGAAAGTSGGSTTGASGGSTADAGASTGSDPSAGASAARNEDSSTAGQRAPSTAGSRDTSSGSPSNADAARTAVAADSGSPAGSDAAPRGAASGATSSQSDSGATSGRARDGASAASTTASTTASSAAARAGTDARADAAGASGAWTVQLGSFGEEENARRLADRVEAQGHAPKISTYRANGRVMYRVRVGPHPSRAAAEAAASTLSAHGFVAQVVTAD